MPKSFSFYNPEEHQHIVATLERKAPVALITATGRNPQRAGAKSPFPMIEDGDFDIPSVFMCEAEGQRLAKAVGHETILRSEACRIPATGCNGVAGRGGPDVPRVVFCAHIDVNTDTSPGAVDNGGGIIVLLLLLDLLKDHDGPPTAQILALNGHEYFAAPGAKLYLQENLPHFSQIALAVNMDGIGYRKGGTAYSLYGCQPGLEQRLRRYFAEQEGFSAGEPWPQSDHMIFAMNGRPAVALTTERLLEIETTITHTPNDTPDLVDCRHLARVALSLRGLMDELGGHKDP